MAARRGIPPSGPPGASSGGSGESAAITCATYRVGYTGPTGLGIYDNYDEAHAVAESVAQYGANACVTISWDPNTSEPAFTPDTEYQGFERITHNWSPDRVWRDPPAGVVTVPLPDATGFSSFAGANFPRPWVAGALAEPELLFLSAGNGPSEAVYYHGAPQSQPASSSFAGKVPAYYGAAAWGGGGGARHLVRLDYFGGAGSPNQNQAVLAIGNGMMVETAQIRATRGLLLFMGEVYRVDSANQVITDTPATYNLRVRFTHGPDEAGGGYFDPVAAWAANWNAVTIV